MRFKSAKRVANPVTAGKLRRRNLFGFGGKAKTMSSSRMSKDAYNQGYLDKKGFDEWLRSKSKSDNLAPSFASELRRDFDRGQSDRLDHEQRKVQIAHLKAEKRETKAPPPDPDKSLKDQSVEYRGRNIRRTSKGFEVLGETWTSLSQAKQFVDVYEATGGKVRTKNSGKKLATATARKTIEKRVTKAAAILTGKKKNPGATLSQGKAKAYVVEGGSNEWIAEVVGADGRKSEQKFKGKGGFKTAMSWARLRLYEVANPSRFKLFPLDAKPKRRNPEDTAVRMYEEFHGLDSTEVLEYVEEWHRHSWLANLGPLIEMQVRNVQGNRDVTMTFPDPESSEPGDVVMLTVEESGTQLYATGGDQELDLSPNSVLMGQFGMTKNDIRDNMLLGTILQATYRTRKIFQKDGKEEIDFFHVLGKEGSRGVYPVLTYHPRVNRIEIYGGRYYVGKVVKELGASPGVIG